MKKRQNKSFAAPIETLEERRMMSVSYNANTDELVVQAGVGNNTINITHNGNNIRVDHNDDTGSHSDTFWTFDKPISVIKAYGNAGNDTIRLFGGLPRTYCYGGTGDDTMTGAAVTSNPAVFQSFSWFGSDGVDNITGTPLYDAIHGQNGNDILVGGAHQDAIFGGNDNDNIRGNDGDDWLYGDNGNDYIYGDNGADHIYGINGNDVLFGGEHNDVINGGYGNDYLYGGNGDDYFETNDGYADCICGEAGNDTAWDRDHLDSFYQ